MADDPVLEAFGARARQIRAMPDPWDAEKAALGLIREFVGCQGLAADLRAEQVLRAWEGGATISDIQTHLGVSRKAAYELLARGREVSARLAARPVKQPVVSAVVTSRKGVLVTRRRDGTPPWAFVGGEIDQGESPEDAGLRELKEETGMAGRNEGKIFERIHPATGRLMIYMDVRPVRGRTEVFVGDERELLEVRWVSAAEAEQLMPDMAPEVLAHVRRRAGR